MASANEFSRPVVIEPWPEGGVDVALSADPAERRALARRFDLLELEALRATGRLERHAASGDIRFEGWLEAALVQACVLSLEPVPASLREPIERRWRRVDGLSRAAPAGPEIWRPDDDEVELVTGRTLDLGEMVAEELALALDPYPRAADALALVSERLGPNISLGEAEPPETPLAALAQLQQRRARATAGAQAEVEIDGSP